MIKRLEQVAALVVAAGLALVSYWLFFSWAQGGGSHRRQVPQHPSRQPQSSLPQPSSFPQKPWRQHQQEQGPLAAGAAVELPAAQGSGP